METTDAEVLNVTLLEPRLKHPTIFSRFDALPPGGSLVILNDHDPKPLYYQLLGERGDVFEWEYLEQGPQWWRVHIRKRGDAEPGETLGQITASDMRKAAVFSRYNLDFSCGGRKTLREACMEKGIDAARVEQELQQLDQEAVTSPDAPGREWTVEQLCRHIETECHLFLQEQLPLAVELSGLVVAAHRDAHPELDTIDRLLKQLAAELQTHLVKEKQVLFPYIRSLSMLAPAGQQPEETRHFGSIRRPISMMEMEHEVIGGYLQTIRKITRGFTPPPDACDTFQRYYRLLKELDTRLNEQLHVENNLLYPAAVALEPAGVK